MTHEYPPTHYNQLLLTPLAAESAQTAGFDEVKLIPNNLGRVADTLGVQLNLATTDVIVRQYGKPRADNPSYRDTTPCGGVAYVEGSRLEEPGKFPTIYRHNMNPEHTVIEGYVGPDFDMRPFARSAAYNLQAPERRRDIISAARAGAVACAGFGISLIASNFTARYSGDPALAETVGLSGIGLSMAWGVGTLIRMARRNRARNTKLDAVADIPLLEVRGRG